MGIIRILFYSSISSLKVDGNLRIESKHKDGSRPTRRYRGGRHGVQNRGLIVRIPLADEFRWLKREPEPWKVSSDTDFSADEQNISKKRSHGDIGDLTMTQIPLEFSHGTTMVREEKEPHCGWHLLQK